MAVTPNRGSTWTNSDGLVVGFGTNEANLTGGDQKGYGMKTRAVKFDWEDLNAGSTITIPVPAGATVHDVVLRVETAFASTGSNTITVGDGDDGDGYISASATATASLTAGAVIAADGALFIGDTDATARSTKTYSSADTVDIASAQTDWSAGDAVVTVYYTA